MIDTVSVLSEQESPLCGHSEYNISIKSDNYSELLEFVSVILFLTTI
jgi:hypothetical protein